MALIGSDNESPILGIMDYLRIIRERWLLGLALGILLAGMWSLYQLSRTPDYTSSVQVLVEVMDDNVVDMKQVVDESEVISRSFRAESLLNHHLIQMSSREFRQYVVESLSLSQINRILDPYRTAELAEPNIHGILANALSIAIDGKALVYTISATHRSPEVAALIADTYATQYIRYVLSDVGSSNDSAISFLDQKAKGLKELIYTEERALQEFRRTNRIVSIEASQQLAINQLQQYQTEQTRLTVELQSLVAIMDQVDATDDELAELLKIPDIAGYRNVGSYKQEYDLAKAAREQLSIDLLDRHPKMIENQSVINEYENLLRNEVEFAVRSLDATVAKLNAQFDSNNQRIQATQTEVQRLDELAIEYDSRVRSIAIQKNTLTQIADRLNETQISSQLSNANMRIIDSAFVPFKPSSPDKKKTIMVAVALLGMGLIGLPIGMNFLDDKLKTPWDIEEFLGKPLLGEIFRFTSEQRKSMHKLVREGKDDLMVDTFRAVYNTVKLNDRTHSDKKIQVITSTIPDEGKTMFSMNYGQVVSQHGAKTLLIDCDLRKPRIEKYMGLTVEHGLVDWFNSADPIPNGNLMASNLGIQEVDTNTFVLPAGKASNKSTEMVESKRFKELIDRLSEEFDHIIIDTPPIGVFPDAMFLAEYANDVIYVSSYNRVSRKTVKHFVNQLDKTNANVCGLVLNGRKNVKSGGAYGYNYGYNYKYASKYYGKYYQQDEHDEKKS